MNKREAKRLGRHHGRDLAAFNIPKIGQRIDKSIDPVIGGLDPLTGLGEKVTEDNVKEYHELLCFAAADHSRCYSPAEFLAKEFNDAGDRANGLWDAYEDGVARTIRAEVRKFTVEDYR